jgi:hypothetical protein
MQVDSTMVINTGNEVVLLSGNSHDTHAIFADAGRMTTPESSHEKADFFGVLQLKNRYIQLIDGQKICILPFNKLVAYHDSFKWVLLIFVMNKF